MTKNTVPVLLEHEVLQIGDVLELNRESFRRSEKVLDARIESRSEDDNFWRCQITERTTESQEVKYLDNDRYYRLTALTSLIAERLGAQNYEPRAVDYWLHPRHQNQSLWQLRKRIQ